MYTHTHTFDNYTYEVCCFNLIKNCFSINPSSIIWVIKKKSGCNFTWCGKSKYFLKCLSENEIQNHVSLSNYRWCLSGARNFTYFIYLYIYIMNKMISVDVSREVQQFHARQQMILFFFFFAGDIILLYKREWRFSHFLYHIWSKYKNISDS